jgi:hypothetical protein
MPQQSAITLPEIPDTPTTPIPVHTSTPTRAPSDLATPIIINIPIGQEPSWRPNTTSQGIASPSLRNTTQHPANPESINTPIAPTNDDTIPYDMDITTDPPTTTTQKSVRFRQKPERLSPKMSGKTHINK